MAFFNSSPSPTSEQYVTREQQKLWNDLREMDANWLETKAILDNEAFLNRHDELVLKFPRLQEMACYDFDSEAIRRILELNIQSLRKGGGNK